MTTRKIGWLLSCLLASACTPPPPERPSPPPAPAETKEPVLIPVGDDDPTRGRPDALTTVVVFGDYECPHCRRANAMLADLLLELGPDQLRIVWKHFPVDKDSLGRSAAELSIAFRVLAGDGAFWTFHDRVFQARGPDSTLEESIAAAIAAARGGTSIQLDALAQRAVTEGRRKVDVDLALGLELGVSAIPTLFINGVRMEGIESKENLAHAIGQEIAATRALASSGKKSDYGARVAENLRKNVVPVSDEDLADQLEPLDETIYHVPIAGSPTLGPATAPITLVEFADFECGFCAQAAPTLKALREKYGDKLRIVFKHNPLGFHERATPAASLAEEVRVQKGDAAFFAAHEKLLASYKDLSDAVLLRVGTEAGLSEADARAALVSDKHALTIERDQTLADEVGASGTPNFYVNGRRVRGARSVAYFSRVIDAELLRAEGLLKAGTAPDKLYEAAISGGKTAPPLQKVDLPTPSKASPAKGPKDAPVLVQVFADFECGYCRLHAERLRELDQAFPGKLRFVFHNLPLEFHARAIPAATAALDAKRQGGDAGFWKMHDAIFANQSSLEDQALADTAESLGLSGKEVLRALGKKGAPKLVEDDLALAKKLGVTGTPTTFINGYRVGGAAPLVRLKKAVRLALSEPKKR